MVDLLQGIVLVGPASAEGRCHIVSVVEQPSVGGQQARVAEFRVSGYQALGMETLSEQGRKQRGDRLCSQAVLGSSAGTFELKGPLWF